MKNREKVNRAENFHLWNPLFNRHLFFFCSQNNVKHVAWFIQLAVKHVTTSCLTMLTCVAHLVVSVKKAKFCMRTELVLNPPQNANVKRLTDILTKGKSRLLIVQSMCYQLCFYRNLIMRFQVLSSYSISIPFKN